MFFKRLYSCVTCLFSIGTNIQQTCWSNIVSVYHKYEWFESPLELWVSDYLKDLKQWKICFCSPLQYFNLANISIVVKILGFESGHTWSQHPVTSLTLGKLLNFHLMAHVSYLLQCLAQLFLWLLISSYSISWPKLTFSS